MNSISTNPFETDDSDADFSTPMSGVKRLRKKRKAPLPPTQANVITFFISFFCKLQPAYLIQDMRELYLRNC